MFIVVNSIYSILTTMMASIGATNVQMAYVPLPEDNQQLQANCITVVQASIYVSLENNLLFVLLIFILYSIFIMYCCKANDHKYHWNTWADDQTISVDPENI